MILTTHNLIVIYNEVPLLEENCDKMARKTLDWILTQESTVQYDRHIRKDCAYAWRQMVFYLTMCGNVSLIEEGI